MDIKKSGRLRTARSLHSEGDGTDLLRLDFQWTMDGFSKDGLFFTGQILKRDISNDR